MDYDAAPPFPLDQYRRVQLAIPGVEGMYRVARAAFEARLGPGARILVAGGGGGREVDALAPAEQGFRLDCVDPSAGMLALTRQTAEGLGAEDRVALHRGLVSDLPREQLWDAATALLVMHFLPDDGAKLGFLLDLRARVAPGAPLLLADVCFAHPEERERLAPVFLRHALLAGLTAEEAALGTTTIRDMPIVSEDRTRALLGEAGFLTVTPLFRGLWYATWMAE